MIKIVPDTMVLVQGLLSNNNNPRKIINLAMSGGLVLYGSSESFAEFKSTIRRPDILKRTSQKAMSPEYLETCYSNIVLTTEPHNVYEDISISEDTDDDKFIRIAKFQNIRIVVSRDKDLLRLGEYDGIKTITPDDFLNAHTKLRGGFLYKDTGIVS